MRDDDFAGTTLESSAATAAAGALGAYAPASRVFCGTILAVALVFAAAGAGYAAAGSPAALVCLAYGMSNASLAAVGLLRQVRAGDARGPGANIIRRHIGEGSGGPRRSQP